MGGDETNIRTHKYENSTALSACYYAIERELSPQKLLGKFLGKEKRVKITVMGVDRPSGKNCYIKFVQLY